MKIVKTRTPGAVAVDTAAIPSHQSDAMCRTVLGGVARLFENPAVMADYKRWKQERSIKGTNEHRDQASG